MRTHKQPLPFVTTRGRVLAVLGVVVLAVSPVAAQVSEIFPLNPPRQTYADDVSSASAGALPVGISQYIWTQVPIVAIPPLGSSTTAVACGGGFWGTHLIQDSGKAANYTAAVNRPHPLAAQGNSAVFVIDQSVAGNTGYLPTDWDNFRFEFDFSADANAAVGVVWGGHPVTGLIKVQSGYLFYIDELPTQTEAVDDGKRARWHLVRRQSEFDLELDSGDLVLNGGVDDLLSVYSGGCYRLRLEFFCGTLRIQIARLNCGVTDCTVTQCYGGTTTCSPENYEICSPNPIEWCSAFEWVDTEPLLVPGFVGPFAGGTDTVALGVSRFDNLVASTWDYDCGVLCAPWPAAWDDTFSGAVEEIDLKFLYTGSLIDYQYGYIFGPDRSFVDVTAKTGPTDVIEIDGTPDTRDECGGWTVLHSNVEKPVVDLPSWDAGDSNLAELLAFLEPMSSSVKLVYDSSATPTLSFVDDFDNRRDIAGVVNADYNPNPLPTRGATPIKPSLDDAFEWYVNQRTVGDYSDDPLADCRLWYVIFITDGEESCCAGGPPCSSVVPDWACESSGPAAKFADPSAFGYSGVDPVAVYTVGFSEDFGGSVNSPLECIADITGGRFFSATDAGQLVDVLYDVLDEMEETDRAFIPFAVAPPPPSAGGQIAADDDFLTVYPFFIPRNQQSVWDGDLLAFALNRNQLTLPLTADCDLDTNMVVWTLGGAPSGANEILEDQIINSTRNVFMGSDVTGSWTRYDLDQVFTNATLRADFKSLLDISGGASDLQAVEVVNFVRDIYVNPGALALTPAPVDPPRPLGYHALGDIYHSQPVVVAPPREFLFYSDFGLGPAPGYMTFMAEQAFRRRVVLAGANDGQLHAFDGGFHDRDSTNYNDRHDLGTGVELFSWVPEAVTDRLHRLTYGTEHLYTVDGSISVSDVYIDYDGDTDREWRTVALSTMRRGGRGVLALDITTPDPILAAGDYKPPVSVFPGCLDGTASGCDAEYPSMMWEFHDVDGSGVPNDDDGGCAAAGFSGDQCPPYYDLGWTWSKPAIGRIGVYAEDSFGNVIPDAIFVAFFGGGWDATEDDITGNYLYAVDIETGATLLKENIGVSVPGSPTIFDSNNDGFHDRIYFGDTNGTIWRLQYPSPFLMTATGATAGTLRRIFSVPVDLTDPVARLQRQQFFVAPTVVPVLFDGIRYTYAVVIGAGDRANLGDETADTFNKFYAVIDDLDNDSVTNPAYDLTDLIARDYTDLTNSFTPEPGSTVCTDSAFSPPHKGWALSLREDEKVNYEAAVFAGHVFFTTFEPGDTLTATNPPEICTPAPAPTPTPGPGPTPTPVPTPPPGGGVEAPVCKASGIGRLYNIGMTCGLGEYNEVNDLLTGLTTYTIGNVVRIQSTTSGGPTSGGGPPGGGQGAGYAQPNQIFTSTTNWRQE